MNQCKQVSLRLVLVLIFGCTFFGCILLSGCSGDGRESPSNEHSGEPDLSIPVVLPSIRILGAKTVVLSVGDGYNDAGAVASNGDQVDISHFIETEGVVDTQVAGDYWLKYQIVESNGNAAVDFRLVRVFDEFPIRQSLREENLFDSTLAFAEHLPLSYGRDESLSPLIIFNHGSGSTNTGRVADAACCSLTEIIRRDTWDTQLPFVVLSPQRVSALDTQALDEFVQFAIEHYQVDPSRVYMVGWSQGAHITLRYAADYPNQLAAMVPLAGGLFSGIPDHFCDSRSTPMWIFSGESDLPVINNAVSDSLSAYNRCGPDERGRHSHYLTGDHFTTAQWPFLLEESHEVSSDSDLPPRNVFDWLLSFQLNNN